MEIEIIDKSLKNENFYKRYKREILLSELLKEDSDINIDYKTFYLISEGQISAIVRNIDFYKKIIKIFLLDTYSGKIIKELIKDGFSININMIPRNRTTGNIAGNH